MMLCLTGNGRHLLLNYLTMIVTTQKAINAHLHVSNVILQNHRKISCFVFGCPYKIQARIIRQSNRRLINHNQRINSRESLCNNPVSLCFYSVNFNQKLINYQVLRQSQKTSVVATHDGRYNQRLNFHRLERV